MILNLPWRPSRGTPTRFGKTCARDDDDVVVYEQSSQQTAFGSWKDTDLRSRRTFEIAFDATSAMQSCRAAVVGST
jgi:hypothetical protein